MTGRVLFPLFFLFVLSMVAMAGPIRGQDTGFGFGEFGDEPRVVASLVSEARIAELGKPFRVAVKLVHTEGNHSFGKVLSPGITGSPTVLRWTVPDGWMVEDLPWPPVHKMESATGVASEGYEGTVYLPVRLIPPTGAATSVEISVNVDLQACDDAGTCLPMEITEAITVPVAEVGETNSDIATILDSVEASGEATTGLDAAGGDSSLFSYLLLAFLGGLILNVMPCVFPVLGIKVLGVVQQAGGDRRQVVLHGVAYTFGILVSFWALGALVISLGKGWGFQLQSPPFVFGLSAFFLIFALNMAGVFEIGTSASGIGAGLQSKHGLGGSFFSGLLATVVATPCSAPFMGAALGVTLALPPFQAMLIFTLIGLGLASPFLILSFAPRLVSALPRPGAWMESFKQALSFLLFGTVAFLVWVLTGMMEGLPMLLLMFGLVLVALGCWIYGRWSMQTRAIKARVAGFTFAALAIGSGLWLGWPHMSKLKWEAWSTARVAELRAADTPVYIDFTAKWCVTCQVNKRVYRDRDLQDLLARKKVVLLKADWTNEDPEIKKQINAYGKAAIPVNVLYIPGADEPYLLPNLLTVANVSEALEMLPDPAEEVFEDTVSVSD